ncbi:MAG: hypothetical protein R3A13_10730 [Bdellovibrionota bacterium]
MRLKILFFCMFCLLGLTSYGLGCGGGGGGGGFVGAAVVNVSNSPRSIDTGDRTQVKTTISEVHDNGISLKFRYPTGLTYVSDSSFLIVGSSRIDVGPTINQGDGTHIYLVYYFDADTFRSGRAGTLTFELEARSEVSDGRVEVDQMLTIRGLETMLSLISMS